MHDIEYLRKNNLIILECISGSRAYGLDLPTSDTDIKGVFVASENNFFGLDQDVQINNTTNDVVFYELRRFIELLLKNNPNLLELLATPDDCILNKSPLLNLITPKLFLSKLCKSTFAEYAIAQIRKAKGLNKKISNPISEERKTILDFCYVAFNHGSIPLKKWLETKRYFQEKCGLVKINHMNDIYGIYYDHEDQHKFRGIMNKENSNDVCLSSIPETSIQEGILYFNRNGYSVYCREYKEYWEWVEKRNEVRYENTISHGKNYDSKNMMHVFRLLNMAEEIALYKKVIVRRPEREYLLSIRRGEFLYEDLVKQAEEKIERIEELYETSDLPDSPDKSIVEEVLVDMRKRFYA